MSVYNLYKNTNSNSSYLKYYNVNPRFVETGNTIQCAAALQTLQTIIDAMSRRFKPEHVVEILDFLFVFDRADEKLENLAELIITTMEQRKPSLVKELTMSLLVSCVTSRDTIEQNPIFSRLLSSYGLTFFVNSFLKFQ